MMGYWHGDASPWGYAVMVVVMVLFWGSLIALGIAGFRSLERSDRDGESPPAEDVLADRFARGEIDEEDYRHRLEVLRNSGDHSSHLSKSR